MIADGVVKNSFQCLTTDLFMILTKPAVYLSDLNLNKINVGACVCVCVDVLACAEPFSFVITYVVPMSLLDIFD